MSDLDDLDRLIESERVDRRFIDAFEDAEDRSRMWQSMVDWTFEQKITQKTIGTRMGVAQSTISQFEAGGDHRLSTMQRYARAINGRLEFRFIPNGDDEAYGESVNRGVDGDHTDYP